MKSFFSLNKPKVPVHVIKSIALYYYIYISMHISILLKLLLASALLLHKESSQLKIIVTINHISIMYLSLHT
jgi:hypothetical protein